MVTAAQQDVSDACQDERLLNHHPYLLGSVSMGDHVG